MYKSNNRKSHGSVSPQTKQVLRINPMDEQFDPVVIDAIPDNRVECKNCLGFATNPYRGQCKAGEVQYHHNEYPIKINCSSFYTTRQNQEIVWE